MSPRVCGCDEARFSSSIRGVFFISCLTSPAPQTGVCVCVCVCGGIRLVCVCVCVCVWPAGDGSMSACGWSAVLLRRVGVLVAPPPACSRALSSSACVLSVGKWRRAEHVTQSSGRTYRNPAPAANFLYKLRPLSRYDPLDLGEVEENMRRALTCKHLRRFIIEPELARLVTEHLAADIDEGKAIIFECNPGPGVLTRTLLNCGAHRVVALESDKAFLPELQELECKLDGQLQVLHCDFFKLDPIGQGSMKPPVMFSEKLFTQLGISEVPWTADVPVKVVGIFSQRNERNMLWKLVYALYERISVFRYGRVEFIMFISEREYNKLVARPGDYRNYQALSALWQMACDIELLHQEPWSSFVTASKHGGPAIRKSTHVPNDHLCLVRITPREDFFSSSVTPFNSSTMVMMVKQCLTKRRCRLIDKLNSWSAGSGADVLLKLGQFEDVLTGQISPSEYKRLFELMEKSEEFKHSWLYDEILENTKNTGCG